MASVLFPNEEHTKAAFGRLQSYCSVTAHCTRLLSAE